MLARTEDVAVAITDATAYTTGVQLKLAVRRRPRPWPDPEEADLDEELYPEPFDLPFGRLGARLPHRGKVADEILRFGVEFADGRRGTTLDELWLFAVDEDEEEPTDRVVLQMRDGGGGGDSWHSGFWMWPLPPPGAVAFVVEWPSERIAETRHEVGAELFLAASRQSETLWPERDSRGHEGPSWSGYGVIRLVPEPDDDEGGDEPDTPR